MALKNEKGGAGVSFAWAAVTPLLLVAAALTVVGIPFLPALCVYLDGRSRTYAGAATLAVGMAVATYFLGAPALAVFSCIVIPTASIIILRKMKQPFSTGLAGAAIGGVLGTLALLGILGGSLGKPLNEAAASAYVGVFSDFANHGNPYPLDLFASIFRGQEQPSLLAILSGAGGIIPPDIQSMSVADKVAIIQPVMETTIAVIIPALALAGGLLIGGVGYWLPSLMLARRAQKEGREPEVAVPPFASFKVPKYIVISILLVQMAAMFASSPDNMGWVTVQWSAEWTLGLIMNVQALSLISFLLNRKRVATGLQVLIFIPAVVLFSWMLTWVGIFDTLFDLRAVLPRVEQVRSSGKQVFSQDGLDELRKMQQKMRERNDKNGKDGEDGKK